MEEQRSISWQVVATFMAVAAAGLVGVGYSGVVEKIRFNKEASEVHRAKLWGHEGLSLEIEKRANDLRLEHTTAIAAINLELKGINDKLERIRDRQMDNNAMLSELAKAMHSHPK